MHNEVIQVCASDQERSVGSRDGTAFLRLLECPPSRLIPDAGFARDVLEVNPLAEEQLEELIDAVHGDRRSFLTLLSPPDSRKSLRSNDLVRPARFERATSWFVARRSIQLS